MNRLSSELHRLFVSPGPVSSDAEPGSADLIDPAGQVRAMVLGLSGPADWTAISRVWRGVQDDLDLPAPAIAVAGEAGYQLWFSLADAESAPRALAFLQALCRRYLGDVEPRRIGLLPAPDPRSGPGFRHATLIPDKLAPGGPWSAFVAADLAPMFCEEPWLDMPPSPEGQAELLARQACMPRADFLRALAQLVDVRPTAAPAHANAVADASPLSSTARPKTTDPRRFLTDVMNDERVELALRIEAAKVLLHSSRSDDGGEH
jgi:hypothetical protein